jgi:hypothetical protein
MVTRRKLLAVCGGFLGVLVAAAGLRAASMNSLEYLTFSQSVALPGVTLAAGSYSFEIADPNGSNMVVLVRERASHKPVYLGFTNRIDRPAGRKLAPVVFGEPRRGEPTPILVWYTADEGMSGREFIYR